MVKNKNSQKPLTLSIIIPVYNEENYLSACLDSIAAQSVKPLEVIVVDNNSTDSSMRIAKRYPFVKILHESRQHQAFAQYKGFKAAKGDIIGRIDADTILPKNWCENLLSAFLSSPDILAVTGSGKPYDFTLKKTGKFILNKYYIIAYHLAGHTMMWGSNCAFRKQAWRKIKNDLVPSSDVWEDYDLAFCIGKYGKISLRNDIEVRTSFRAVHKPVWFQIKYQFRAVKTFRRHRSLPRTVLFAVVWSSLTILIPFVMIDKQIQGALNKRQKIYAR
ncbi:glycosyltransferase family 2 protein [Candidatus Saccharibacteria bacterium]|nr:glycosyltransferase family 2 protein [Candidatus Saccharibacteria bacterium]